VDTPAVKSDRTDHLDAERFRDMVASPPYQLIVRRLQGELERARAACERENSEREVARAQGACAALRTALHIPDIVLEEIIARTRAKTSGG
jgi:hypothetical protein